MNDMTRVKNVFKRNGIDIGNKRQLLSFLTDYTKREGKEFTARSFGLSASLTTMSLYPDDLVVVGNGITSKEGKEYIDKLTEEQRKLFARNKTNETFTVSIDKSLRKTLWNIRETMCHKYKINIPINVVLQEMIMTWGEMNEQTQNKRNE